MREAVTEDERRYIKENILDPLSKDVDKLPLFGDMARGKLMLETSVQRLKFDRKNYEIKLDYFREINNNGWEITIAVRPKDCSDSVGMNVKIT